MGLNHVEPGGAPLVARLSNSVTMIKVSVGPVDNNAYLLQHSRGGAVLIDAANDDDRLLKIISDLPLDAIVTTHRHADHWQALPPVATATRARLVCGQPDLEAISSDAWVEGLTGVWDGDRIDLGSESLEVIGLVGIRRGRSPPRTQGAVGCICSPGTACSRRTWQALPSPRTSRRDE
jgi:glyoxylase-like metal-dependent hydrolase (beta-lactamase superfamily II)